MGDESDLRPSRNRSVTLDAIQNDQATGRRSQLLYALPIDFAMDGSVDPDGEATAHESRVRSHLPASVSLSSRQINIGRGGDGLGLLLEIAGLATALFYGAPHTSAALD